MKKWLAGMLSAAVVMTAAGIPAYAKSGATVHYTQVTGAVYVTEGDGYKQASKEQYQIRPGRTVYIALDMNNVHLDKTEATDQKVYPALDNNGTEDHASLGSKHLSGAFMDSKMFRFKASKGEDDKKIIKSMSLAEKDVDGDGSRNNCIKIELNDDFTDKEFKITPEFTFTAKTDIRCEVYGPRTTFVRVKDGGSIESNDGTGTISYGIPAGTKYVLKADAFKSSVGGTGGGPGTALSGAIYIGNEENRDSDQTWSAGAGGYVCKPVRNEDNTITWENENRELAKLSFYSDSGTIKYYPKLSTKWNDTNYRELFNDQDAYIFKFVGNPRISSTSRPVLTIFNPYYDAEEEVFTADPENIRIYEIVNDELIDATAAFKHEVNEDGDDVFITRARTLGTYIFVEESLKDVSEEAGAEPAPDEKPIPNTGR